MADTTAQNGFVPGVIGSALPAGFAESVGPLTTEAAITEANRCLYCFDAPCQVACPTHIDIPSFIRKIATDNLPGSARTILAANPLGATCARACPVEVLCEGACVRNDIDRPIEIGRLQRHATDAYIATGRPFYEVGAPVAGRHVAIVGGGPAGLACAVELRRHGIAATVYEAKEHAGGLADSGIVPWRLEHSIPTLEVAEVERAGVEIRRGVAVGRDVALADLVEQSDAVYLATGLSESRRLGIPGEDAAGDALEILRRVSGGRGGPEISLGRRVAIIGAGSTALDAAAVAARIGCDEVTVFYRRTEAEAPAHPHSIELARTLGVRFAWLASPVEMARTSDGVAVTFDTMALGEPDASGRRAPRPVEGARFTRSFDTVLRAVGHMLEDAAIQGVGVPQRGGVLLVEDETSGRTIHPKIWAGGDAVNGGAEVVNAVEAGKQAARSMLTSWGIAIAPAEDPNHGPRIEITTDAGLRRSVDLSTNTAGIRSPNPFWLASAPPTNTGEMVARAFEAGWGGAVWKTIGDPIVNVSPRLGAINVGGNRMTGINNIELISDRPTETNLREIAEVKKLYPNHAVIVSLMLPMERETWHDLVKRVNDTGADGIELNFGCPHGMAERGMGAAIGQVPEFSARCTEWAKEAAQIPVLVKLTPNITDITAVARAVVAAGADGVSMINTINSLVGVDLTQWTPSPSVAGKGTHGGYAGPAVKPIALNMVAECARDPKIGVPISGMGGVTTWRDAIEFLLLGSSSVQVCTAVMHYGYRIIDDLVDGLASYLAERGLTRPADLTAKTVPTITSWGNLDQSFHVVAKIDQEKCVHCGLCHRACEDGAHQSISLRSEGGKAFVEVIDETCVGCRLCEIVCPVEGCISMVPSAHAPEMHDLPVAGGTSRLTYA